MWRKLRVAILVLALATVIQQTWLEQKSLDWEHNFYVALYPVNADGSEEVSRYLQSLSREDFEPIAQYFAEQAAPYQLGLRRPIELQLGSIVKAIPPAPPTSGSVLDTMLWSLKFKYFAWRHSPKVNVKPEIRLYLLYHDPKTSPRLSHSTALNKGRIGRVNLFGERSYAKQNAVIIAHELLHTLNATDKYDLNTTLPIYPQGFAEPQKSPLYPQVYAELMGGRIPLHEQQAVIPKSLASTLIGRETAREIGWLKSSMPSDGQ
jgi:hypothetical protein